MPERLAVTRSVTLNAAGGGTIAVGPSKYGETWVITRLSTRGVSTIEPVLSIFRGLSGGQLLDTTKRGNNDISDSSVIELRSGETLSAVYTVGTVGAIMTFFVEGDIKRGV